jgi:hypothetical protein
MRNAEAATASRSRSWRSGASLEARPTGEALRAGRATVAVAVRRSTESAPQTEFIQIVTDDPGIVILWALDDVPQAPETEGRKRKGASL